MMKFFPVGVVRPWYRMPREAVDAPFPASVQGHVGSGPARSGGRSPCEQQALLECHAVFQVLCRPGRSVILWIRNTGSGVNPGIFSGVPVSPAQLGSAPGGAAGPRDPEFLGQRCWRILELVEWESSSFSRHSPVLSATASGKPASVHGFPLILTACLPLNQKLQMDAAVCMVTCVYLYKLADLQICLCSFM